MCGDNEPSHLEGDAPWEQQRNRAKRVTGGPATLLPLQRGVYKPQDDPGAEAVQPPATPRAVTQLLSGFKRTVAEDEASARPLEAPLSGRGCSATRGLLHTDTSAAARRGLGTGWTAEAPPRRTWPRGAGSRRTEPNRSGSSRT